MKGNKLILLNQSLLGFVSFLMMSTAQADTALWTLTPLTATTVAVSPIDTATVQYLVTNESGQTQTLVMQPITGISQVTSSGNCPNPFTLNNSQSCTLTLEITGSTLPGNMVGGPIVCQNGGGSLECYHPNAGQELNITAIPGISISAPTQPNRVINVGSTTPLKITVTNNANSSFNADNIQATLPTSWTNVTQDASNCTSIAPGDSCTLNFTSTTPYEPEQIIISGSNTKDFILSTYLAFFDGGGIVFSVNGGIVKVVDTLEVYPTKIQWHAPTATGPNNSSDLFDGAANTADIVSFFGNTNNYAASLCVNSTAGGYDDWYLPAICELGRYLAVGNDPICGSNSNLLTGLHQKGFGRFITDNSSTHSQAYWSSTNNPSLDKRAIWNQNLTDLSISNASGENNYKEARCVRSFAM